VLQHRAPPRYGHRRIETARESIVRSKPRIGCIVPAINVVAEEDLVALCPPGAAVHFARADVALEAPLRDQLAGMVEAAPALARCLAKADVGVVAFACTSASFVQGPGADELIGARMTAAAGVPCLTTTTAVLEALRTLGVRRLGLATPYVDWVVEAERAFLLAMGFEVLASNGLGLAAGRDIHAVPPARVRELALEVAHPDADAVFISCTDLQALAIVPQLEAATGRPVVTSNQATFWACARRLGLPPVVGRGVLLAEHLRQAAA
jgi:maleate cis-trans isomerase